MPEPTDHLKELRRSYAKATPRQRYQVALLRIENPDRGPNLLVNYIAAVEGFSRSLAVTILRQRGRSSNSAYNSLRNTPPAELIQKHICPHLGVVPEAIFGVRNWRLFQKAVQYRNLLVHEATYLGQDRYPALLSASRAVFDKLAERTGVA